MISMAYLRDRRRRADVADDATPGHHRRSDGVIARLVGVTVAWVALWGDPAPAVWLAGLLVGVVTLVVLPPRRTLGARVGGVLRLGVEVARQLARATAGVVRVVLTPHPAVTRVLTVEAHLQDPRRLAMLCLLVTLTPGSTVVELRPERGELDVNVLSGQPDDAVRADVERMAAAIRGAVGPSPVREVAT